MSATTEAGLIAGALGVLAPYIVALITNSSTPANVKRVISLAVPAVLFGTLWVGARFANVDAVLGRELWVIVGVMQTYYTIVRPREHFKKLEGFRFGGRAEETNGDAETQG